MQCSVRNRGNKSWKIICWYARLYILSPNVASSKRENAHSEGIYVLNRPRQSHDIKAAMR